MPLAWLIARAILRRLVVALLALALCYVLTLWTLSVLGRLEPGRLGSSPLFEYANLLCFGVPSLSALFGSSELLPLGAAYPLFLYALVLIVPRRRRLGWWLGGWLIGASSALMGSLSLAFASLEFREMVTSGAFPTLDLIGMWWRIGQEALILTLRSGTLLLGFPLAIFVLEGALRTLGGPTRVTSPQILEPDTAKSSQSEEPSSDPTLDSKPSSSHFD